MKISKLISFYHGVSYLLLLGVIHAALTPVFYNFFTPDGMWFFGTGLTLVFLSLMNIAASKLLNIWFLKLTLFANIVGTLFSIMISIILNEAQAYISLVFHLIVLFACVTVIKNLKYETNKQNI